MTRGDEREGGQMQTRSEGEGELVHKTRGAGVRAGVCE